MGTDNKTTGVEAFIAKWQGQEGGQERANYALFLTELCDLIDVDHPEPAGATHERNDYVFERVVTRRKDDGDTLGRIDLYKKDCFVLEAKQSRWKGQKNEVKGTSDLFSVDASNSSRGKRGADRAWDVLMLNAKRQAEDYARAADLARLAALHPHLRCRPLHRGLCGLLRAGQELHAVSGPAELPDLSRRPAQRGDTRTDTRDLDRSESARSGAGLGEGHSRYCKTPRTGVTLA